MMQGRYAIDYNLWEQKQRARPMFKYTNIAEYLQFLKGKRVYVNAGCYPCCKKTMPGGSDPHDGGRCTVGGNCSHDRFVARRMMTENGGGMPW